MTQTPAPTAPPPLQGHVTALSERYADLSRAYARDGQGRLALLAMWAADVKVLQVLLWENGLGEAPDPEVQMGLVGEAVFASLAAAMPLSGRVTLRQVAEHARSGLLATFDESVHAMLGERFARLDHLDGLAPPVPGEAADAVRRLLARRSPETLQADLRTAAADCRAIADEMARDGDEVGARRLCRQADLASFEAHLVATALTVGDHAFNTVVLRRELGVRALRIAGNRREPQDVLTRVVGPEEAPALRARFDDQYPTRR
jgi:hypothetical protein